MNCYTIPKSTSTIKLLSSLSTLPPHPLISHSLIDSLRHIQHSALTLQKEAPVVFERMRQTINPFEFI